MVLTHAKTGHAEYLRAGKDNLLNALRASSSIPVLTRHPSILWVNPTLMAALQMLYRSLGGSAKWCQKLLVLRTRPKNYFKASSRGDQFLAKYAFKHHYGFANSLRNRCARYNASVEFVRSSNPEQQILEVCPPPLKNMAGRLTTNPKSFVTVMKLVWKQAYKPSKTGMR